MGWLHWFLWKLLRCASFCCIKSDHKLLCKFLLKHSLISLQMKVEELRKTFIEKKAQTAHMVERAKEVRNKQDELRNTVSLVCWKFLSRGK